MVLQKIAGLHLTKCPTMSPRNVFCDVAVSPTIWKIAAPPANGTPAKTEVRHDIKFWKNVN
ncbi:MAG: hypothetical protein DRI56_03020 [Chloroflexota bacterium]|nr:MAG: hypothetical protein DRI56_03020 [Chloroflexota bacterium]